MKIETTANMHINILRKIEKASRTLSKSQMYVIRLLLGKLLEDDRGFTRSWGRIKYQKRDLSENWTIFHLNLRQDEYEYAQDLRRVYGMSLSNVIAYAVNKFLDILLAKFTSKEYADKTDNYLYKNYAISHEIIEGIHTWRYCWGYTPKAYAQLE